MSGRERVLALLRKDALLRAARELGVPARPRDRMDDVKAAICDAADVTDARLVSALRRDELRDVCRGLGLMVTGNKGVLEGRILDRLAESPAA